MIRYDASEGMVFDWAEPLYIDVDENGNLIKHFLGVKTVFIEDEIEKKRFVEVKEGIS